jgi:hypothetical protein
MAVSLAIRFAHMGAARGVPIPPAIRGPLVEQVDAGDPVAVSVRRWLAGPRIQAPKAAADAEENHDDGRRHDAHASSLARLFLAALERPVKAGVVEACEGRERHRRVDARQCIRGPRR